MSLWRHATRGLGRLLRPGRAERDVKDEVAHYIEQSGGGHRTQIEEELRSFGWENAVGTTLADLRYALRRLRASPGFSVVAIVTLALGIGAGSAIFSVANPVLFESLPYPHPGQLLMISDVGVGDAPIDVTFGNFVELSERLRAFSRVAVADRWRPSLSGLPEPQRLEGERVSADFFRTLGVAPSVGRDLAAADDIPGGANVVIVSARLARRVFGDDSAVVGRQLELSGDPYTIIGVMPRSFENVIAPGAEVWAPLQYNRSAGFQTREWGHHLRMIGRLRPDASADDARREIAGIARTPFAAFPRPPWADLSQGMVVHALQEDVTLAVRPALLAMIGAVLLVLAIVCVNVTNLLLARGAQRREEFAMRVALGASRGRLVRQLLTESLVLAGLGGAIGLLVARVGVRALVALIPVGVPRMDAIGVDGPVFLFALTITTLTGIVTGLAPALAASREAPQQGLQGGTRRATGRHAAASGALVIAEMALAVVLLAGAGLLLRSLGRLLTTDPGFESSHVLTMQVIEAGHRYDSDTARAQFFAAALDEVRRVPGVASAAFTSQLPLSGDLDRYGYNFASVSTEDPNGDGAAYRYLVSPDYLRTMRIPLRRGRLLDSRDRPGAEEAIVISESFAKRWFKNRDPIGERVRFGPEIGGDRPWDVIVGIVGDVKQASLALGSADAFYVAPGQWPWVDNVQSLVVRTTGDAAALAPSLRRAIWSVDKGQPIVRVATMDDLVTSSEAERRFALAVFEVFALVALVLAAAGIYGVLSGRVAERTREIGVRSALGASRGSILGLILGQGMVLTTVGAAIGLAGALAASRALQTLLFGISRIDPVTYAGVIGLLLAVSALACWIPAWRAARVDPSITLRAE